MKTLSIITISLLLLIGCNQAQNKSRSTANEKIPFMITDTTFNFNRCETEKLPVGWSEAFTGRGTGTRWEVVDDNGNKALAQLSSDNPNYHFNVAVYDGFKVKDVELTVRMKGVDGQMDQGGGFVWRYIDADNYYVVRANPLEDNVVLYKVENGKRSDLPLIGKGRTYGTEVPALGNGWNNLKLTVIDDLFTVFLNGKQIFQVKDKTFTEAGKIGLWTKADAVSYFDDLEVKAVK
jgi:hypothetical protein